MAKKIRTLEDGNPLYELPEVEVVAQPYYKKFLNSLPQDVQQYLQSEARNAILAKQVGSIDNPKYGTISKKDAERNKRNYFDVQALNTAMGSPNVMNQNSFNYNPNIANQQLYYGATYPISTINNAFAAGLGDAAFDYALTKGVPIALDKLGFFVQKPNSFTRGIGTTDAGLRDLQKSGVIRGNPYGTEVTAHMFAKYYRKNRENFKTIIDATGDPSIAQKWFSKSLSKDEFNKLRNAELKINGKSKQNSRFDFGHGTTDFVKQYDTYDDCLKHIKIENPTSVDDTGEALAYFYDDGRNPLTAGHDYASSNYGVRVNNASSYNPRIFDGHLHYSFPQAVKLTDPNVEVFKKIKLGPFNVTRRMNKNDIIRGKFAMGGTIPRRNKLKYRRWLEDVAAIRGWNPNEMDNDLTYDYNLFYNFQPKEAKKLSTDDEEAHFTDIGKTSLHPTFSDESYYSGRKSSRNPRGIIGGHWNKTSDRYTLSNSQIANNWNIRNTIDYMSVAEPNGVELRMPNGTRPYIDGAYFEKVLPQVEITAKRKKLK